MVRAVLAQKRDRLVEDVRVEADVVGGELHDLRPGGACVGEDGRDVREGEPKLLLVARGELELRVQPPCPATSRNSPTRTACE